MGGDIAVELRGVVRPHHDFAAIAILQGISLDNGRGIHKSVQCILYQRIGAMCIATDQDGAAIVGA